MYHGFFVHSSDDEHLGYFHVLAIVNNVARNTEAHMTFFNFGSYGSSTPSFLRNLHSVFHAAKSLHSCPTLCNPIDGSPPGSSVPGILQARTLESAAISFSNAWKWKVKVKSFSCVQLFTTPWTAAHQAPPSMGFSRQEYWSGVPLPSIVSGYITLHSHQQGHDGFEAILLYFHEIRCWVLR